MPGALKRALVRDVARRGSNLNDVAVGHLADRFGVAFTPSGHRRKVIPGASGVAVLRVPAELRRELKAAARRRGTTVNDLALRTLADALDDPARLQRKGLHGHDRQERLEERPREGQGPRRADRRRQLRQLAAPGRRVLQGLPGRPVRPGPDAREPRRVPHLRHRVHGRVRRRRGQGRQGPVRRDVGASERHDQVRRRAEDGDHRLPRHDARRDRQVPLAGRDEVRRAPPTTSSASSRRPARTSSSTISRSAPRRRRSGTPSRSSRPAARW